MIELTNISDRPKRYSPVRVKTDETYGRMLADVMASMESFRQTQQLVFLQVAFEALEAMYNRAKSEI